MSSNKKGFCFVFLGPPGAGKGTQAITLAKDLELNHISTGDLLRFEMKQQSLLGKRAQEFINKGKLVADELVIDMIKNFISQHPDQGFIFDGFPRTLQQAEIFEKFLLELNIILCHVIFFKIEEENLIERLSGRRICGECASIFHISELKDNVHCPKDGAPLLLRKDDHKDVVTTRLQEYYQQTEPLIQFYKKKALLLEINAGKSKNVVFQTIKDAISLEKIEYCATTHKA